MCPSNPLIVKTTTLDIALFVPKIALMRVGVAGRRGATGRNGSGRSRNRSAANDNGAAEARFRSKPRGNRSPPTESPPGSSPGSTPTSLALATHRANFSLMDAPSVVAWIDWVRAGGERPDVASPLSFLAIPYAGRTFLASAEPLWPFHDYPCWLDDLWHDPRWWQHFRRRRLLRRSGDGFAGWFVMEEKSAERFLNSLSAIIRSGRENMPAVLELPRVEPSGFAMDRGEGSDVSPDSEDAYALYRDGLALLGSQPPRRIVGHRIWSPEEGMRSD